MVEAENIIDIMRKSEIRVCMNTLARDEPLIDQGVDSLDMTSIFFAIEERFQLRIDEEDMGNGKLASVNAIIEYINRERRDSCN